MKIINTRLHGILDYLFAIILVLPWVRGFAEDSGDTWMLAAVGGFILFASILTDYELGLIKILPMRFHLFLDVLVALFLMASPWLFGVYNYILWWPFVLGAAGLLIALLTHPVAYRRSRSEVDIARH
jgi:hypothetical protein